MWLTPARSHVVVSGFPATEGNALEMVRSLSARYAGRVFWLVPQADVAEKLLESSGVENGHAVDVLAHRSPQAMWKTVTAELIMFTHGVYGNPAPVAGKTMVNLWHGGGIKGNLMVQDNGEPSIRSDYLVAGTRVIGEILAGQSRVPFDRLLLFGNPRVAQFSRTDRGRLARLGLDPQARFVVWMPTYRKNRGLGLTTGWSDVNEGAADLNVAISEGVRILQEKGVTVVVKPHPQDAESRAVEGALVVSNVELADAGVQLYQLLGMSSGLLTDYSSVWIDYLGLDRPIGFVVPDVDEYSGTRGFDPPDALNWLPGPKLVSRADFAGFARDVIDGGTATRGRRREVAEHWGHVYFEDAPDRILDELSQRGAFRQMLPQRRLEPRD